MRTLLALALIAGSFVAGARWSVHEHRADALVRNIDGVSVAPTAPGFEEPQTATVTLHIGKRQYVLWLDTGFTQEPAMMWHGGPEPPLQTVLVHGNVREHLSNYFGSEPCDGRLPSSSMIAALTLDRMAVADAHHLTIQCYQFEGKGYPTTATAERWLAAHYREGRKP